MKVSSVLFLLPLLGLGAMGCQQAVKENTTTSPYPTVQAPVAKLVPKELEEHGGKRLDNYFWLREKENPEVIDYLNAENAYLDTMTAHTKAFQEKLFNEMKGRIKEKDESAPYRKGDYFYYTRFEEGFEYPLYCRKKGSLDAQEEIMLNANDLAKGKSYFNASVSSNSISPSQEILAYGVDTVSRRFYSIFFKNLKTGETLKDIIPSTTGNLVWANDNKTIFYSKQDPNTLRSEKIFKHTIGTDFSKDAMVYFEKDSTFSVYVTKTKSDKYILLNASQTLSTEILLINASKPNDKPKVFAAREKDLLYDIEHREGKFYIRTNDQARNFRLMECSETKTAKSDWKEVIAHREDVLVEDLEVFKNFVVVSERKEGLAQYRILNQVDNSEHYLEFGEPTYDSWEGTNEVMDTPIFRYNYQSLTTPLSQYDYDMSSKTKTLVKQQEVLGGFNSEDYQSERIYATTSDGVKIPMSIVYKKTTPRDGSAPLLQYAYGSYGSSTDATFSVARLSLLNRGFIYAIAHVRGGQEMGRYWYEDGKLLKKKNTFTDFIACSEHLIAQKYTSKEKLFAYGGSAGGLLMGAIVNMRPDLYKGVIAAVPFVDVISTMMDETIPLTTFEYDEWGNPNDKTYYDYMFSYSPYDNVEKKAYPNLLVTTGLHDSQVQYWEPAKWVAKLRAMKTDKNLLLLYTNMEAGHGGASGRFKSLKDAARNYAFMMDLVGVKE
jgi:oligopeptidase B